MITNQPSLKIKTKQMIDANPDVQRWVNNLNSESAKRIYSEALYKFSEYARLSPKQMVEMCLSNKKGLEDILTDFILSVKGAHTPKVTHNHLVGIKSWLIHNDIVIRRKINCGNTKRAPTTEDESVPSQDDLNNILNHADLRGRAFISLIAFAGLRPTTAINIKLRDFSDLIFENSGVEFSQVPARIKVRAEFSKNGKPYFTFLSTEGCEYVQNYLKARLRDGEIFTEQSPLIMYSSQSLRKSINRKGFSKKIKRTFEKAGYRGRPYVLRSYFDTAMLNSGIQPIYQQFLMGHSGSIEAIYTVNKNLPQYQIDDMREQFRERVEPKLLTIPAKTRNELDYLKGENKELKKKIANLEQNLKNNDETTSEKLELLLKQVITKQFSEIEKLLPDKAPADIAKFDWAMTVFNNIQKGKAEIKKKEGLKGKNVWP